MKVRRLKVGVRPLEEGLQEFGGTLKALQAGKTLSKRGGVYFVSVEAMRRVLTPSRLTLLHLIRTRHPPSIAALAKLIRRDFKNVHADLKLLADLGLVHLEPGAHLRDSITPTVPYERIQFEIAV
jgi:predicted transcriptional regulator